MVRLLALWISFVLVGVAGFGPHAAQANPKFAAITVDARNGKVLFAENEDATRHPASLTKMMTLYLLFEDLSSGKIKLDSPIRMSSRAAGMAPSKLGVKPGKSIPVETAIRALVVKSANDVAAAVAENLGGTEAAFAKRMTAKARALGMRKTTFVNASGLPDDRQVTSARDMATLGLRLMRDFPQYYPYFRSRSFRYGSRTINGHNRLLGRFDGTDGIKTGYIRASGFNLVTSARRGGKRLVGVVLGGRTGNSRNAYMMKMLEKYFPKASNGRTIAAMAGSSKGVIDPVASSSSRKKKVKGSLFGGSKEDESTHPAENVEVAAAAESDATETASTAPAQAAANDGEADDSATQVIESKLDETGGEQTIASLLADSSWVIQVGAYSTKRDAQARLQDLRRKTPDVFEGKTAITIAVQKGDSVTYRARFTGFTKDQAYGACGEIKRQNTGCYVLAPAS